jgi:protein tyrosine kinase
MKSALEPRDENPFGAPFRPLGSGYTIVGKLRSAGRAELFVALPRLQRSIEQVVVIKVYDAAGDDGGADARAQLEVASTPDHENLIRVLDRGWDVGRPFIVREYLEGTTLRRLLRWLDGRGQRLPDAATARILVGMLAAVEHAMEWAHTQQARGFVRQPIEATNVFITAEGCVKVLGFNPRARRAPSGGPPSHIEPAAVDDLLSRQQSPALRAVLARIGKLSSSASLAGLSHVVRILKDWQRHELGSDGALELAEVIAGVQPEERAARRMRVEAALARVVQTRDAAEPASAANGHRSAKSDALQLLERPERTEPPERAEPPENLAAALAVRGAEVVSDLRQVLASTCQGRRARSAIGLTVLCGVLMAGVAVAGQVAWRAAPTSPPPVAAASRALAENPTSPPAEVPALAADRRADRAIARDVTESAGGVLACGSITPEACSTAADVPTAPVSEAPLYHTARQRRSARGSHLLRQLRDGRRRPRSTARAEIHPPASEPEAPTALPDSVPTSPLRASEEALQTDNIDPWHL